MLLVNVHYRPCWKCCHWKTSIKYHADLTQWLHDFCNRMKSSDICLHLHLEPSFQCIGRDVLIEFPISSGALSVLTARGHVLICAIPFALLLSCLRRAHTFCVAAKSCYKLGTVWDTGSTSHQVCVAIHVQSDSRPSYCFVHWPGKCPLPCAVEVWDVPVLH